MRLRAGAACALLCAVIAAPRPRHAAGPAVRVYLTTAHLSQALARQPNLRFAAGAPDLPVTIRVDETRRYQRMIGFGGAMTDTSAWLLYDKLTPAARERVLRRLFAPDPDPRRGIGLSYLRVPIAASDFTADGAPYSYDDRPPGQSDPSLRHFSIAHDLAYVIPLLREARRINPALTLLASPWSPPGWMKQQDTGALSGALAPGAHGAYAAYLVRFVQAYRAQGVPIDAITPQNEPGATAGYPGMVFPASRESDFIAHYLGPVLAAARLRTRILAYDSYWSTAYTTPNYPFVVAGNPAARRYVAGIAWHCYQGSPDVMTRMHDAYPRLANEVTECSSGIAHGAPAELIIASARNWAEGVLLWNLALDTRGGPKEGDGCPGCVAPLTIDEANGRVAYNADYYQLGQASAFVRPGAYRVYSTSPITRGYRGTGLGCGNAMSYGISNLDDVAFQNPDGSLVLLAYNAAPPARRFTVRWHGESFRYTLPACATVTFSWKP